MRLPLTFKWLIELQPPLPFIYLIAFQTFCVCVLEFNLLQKCLHEFLFCCLTTWQALALKSLKFWTLLSVGLEKPFCWAFFLFLIAFLQLSLNHGTLGSFFEKYVFGIALSAAWISRSVNWRRSVNWPAGSSADMTSSSVSSEEHWAWKDSQSAFLKFHLLGVASSSTAFLVRITGKWSLPHRSSCIFHS